MSGTARCRHSCRVGGNTQKITRERRYVAGREVFRSGRGESVESGDVPVEYRRKSFLVTPCPPFSPIRVPRSSPSRDRRSSPRRDTIEEFQNDGSPIRRSQVGFLLRSHSSEMILITLFRSFRKANKLVLETRSAVNVILGRRTDGMRNATFGLSTFTSWPESRHCFVEKWFSGEGNGSDTCACLQLSGSAVARASFRRSFRKESETNGSISVSTQKRTTRIVANKSENEPRHLRNARPAARNTVRNGILECLRFDGVTREGEPPKIPSLSFPPDSDYRNGKSDRA